MITHHHQQILAQALLLGRHWNCRAEEGRGIGKECGSWGCSKHLKFAIVSSAQYFANKLIDLSALI